MKRKLKGSTLVVAVVTLMIAFMLVGATYTFINMSISTLAKKENNTKKYWALESGVNYGLKHLLNLNNNSTNIDVFIKEHSSIKLLTDYKINDSKITVTCNQTQITPKPLWEVISQTIDKNGIKSRLTLKNISVESPFKYSRGIFDGIGNYSSGFRFFGPTYFQNGLLTKASYVNPEISSFPIFYGAVEVPATFASTATKDKIIWNEQGGIVSSSDEKLTYAGYLGDQEFRENWFRANTPWLDKEGNSLDFSEFQKGFKDLEDDWTGGMFAVGDNWSLTGETPKRTLDRLHESFKGGYYGGCPSVSKPNITPKFSEIYSDPKSISLPIPTAGNKYLGIVFTTVGNATKATLMKRSGAYKHDWQPKPWPGTTSPEKIITGKDGLAVPQGYKNIAVKGSLSQSFTIATYDADIEIYDDIAPTEVYNAYAYDNQNPLSYFGNGLVEKFSNTFHNNAVNSAITPEISEAMQKTMDKSKAKIALIAGIEKKADIIVGLSNYVVPNEAPNNPTTTYQYVRPTIIGAGLFSPKGGFGLDYKNARNTSSLVILGTLLTNDAMITKKNPQGQNYGLTGINNDPLIYQPGTTYFTMSGSDISNTSDPRNLSGFNPPFVNNSLQVSKYENKEILEIKISSDFQWIYEPVVAN